MVWSTLQLEFLFTCLLTAFYCFFVGFFGLVFPQKNIIKLLILLELFLIGINLLYIYFSFLFATAQGFSIAIILLVLAGCESGFGLALLLLLYRLKRSLDLQTLQYLKA